MDLNIKRIEISYKTIVFTVFFLLFLYLLFLIKDILLILFLSLVAASGLRPSVNRLEKWRVPRVIAIILVYILVFGFIFLVLSYIIPIFARQTPRLFEQLGYFFSFLEPYTDMSADTIAERIAPYGADIAKATIGVFSQIINFLVFFVITFYLLLERRHLRVFLKNFLGEEMKERVVDVMLRIEHKLGAWVQGELSLMIIVGALTYIGLILLGVEFALPLAIIAGILEIIPIIGPIISGIPAVIVSWIVSPWLALATAALYFLIQQLENHIIVPVVMRKAVGVPPMVSIIAILIGSKLLGIVGALLAIPFFVCIQIIFQEAMTTRKR